MQNFSAQDFFDILLSDEKIQDIPVEDLKKLVNQFNYFPLAQIILCKKYFLENSKKFNEQLEYTASLVPSRVSLYNYLHNQLNLKSLVANTDKALLAAEGQKTKKETKTSSIKQYDLEQIYPEEKNRESLDQWLETLKKSRLDKNNTQKELPINLIKKSKKTNEEELVSETLVKIYELQENWPKAKAAYRSLIKKYPEKKEVYLEKIATLEKK